MSLVKLCIINIKISTYPTTYAFNLTYSWYISSNKKCEQKRIWEQFIFLYFFKITEIYHVNQSIKNHINNLFLPSSSVLLCMLYVCLFVTTYVSSATPRSTTGNPCSRSWAISVVLLLSLILPSCRASSGSTNCQTGTHYYQLNNMDKVYWQFFYDIVSLRLNLK